MTPASTAPGTSMGALPLLTLDVPARSTSLALVRHVLGGLGDRGAVARPALGPVILGISEALSKTVGGPTADRRVRLAVWVDPARRVRAQIEHDGRALQRVDTWSDLGDSALAALTSTIEVTPTEDGRVRMVLEFPPSGPEPGDALLAQSSPLL